LKPEREHATNNAQTYFFTSKTWEGRELFRAEPWARLEHRGTSYLLRGFVLMPDHFHLLISPVVALERALQMVKGGFSYRAKKEPGSNAEIWQRGFADHRDRDSKDDERHVHYIHLNPMKKRLCRFPAEYRYASAFAGWKLDPVPQGLKPGGFIEPMSGTAEAVPFQNPEFDIAAEAVPFQNERAEGKWLAHLGGADVRAEARTLEQPVASLWGSR
jgi:putative transposase